MKYHWFLEKEVSSDFLFKLSSQYVFYAGCSHVHIPGLHVALFAQDFIHRVILLVGTALDSGET